MVKLATVREIRLYGPWLTRNKWEYINAGVYLFATILLIGGMVAQFSDMSAKSGLILIVISLVIIALVNGHDLLAHMAGIDYRVQLMASDVQLGLVEFGAPLIQALGSILFAVGILFVFIQAEKGRGHLRLGPLGWHALNMLVAGPVLWVIGSINNVCQVYERADRHIQILQQSVYIPFLMGSLLFVVGSILNRREHFWPVHRGLELLGRKFVSLGIAGGIFLFIGGLMNLVKVFKMQQMDGIRLEKLRGGAQELLIRERDGRVPLIIEEQRRRKFEVENPLIIEEQRRRKFEVENPRPAVAAASASAPGTTPYKDVLIGQA